MRLLVTGASGHLAPYVISELAGGHELVLFSRSRPRDEVVRDHTWLRGDLQSFEDVRRAMEGVEVVQHLGAQSWPSDHPGARKWAGMKGVAGKVVPFDATMKSNVLGTYYVLQAAVREGVRAVVVAGSNCATGAFFRISHKPWPVHYLPVDEGHPSDVEDTYSFTKLAIEELAASYTRAFGLPTYVTRLAWICEPDIRVKLHKRVRRAREWVTGMWTWVSSEDAARAHRMIMDAALADGSSLPRHDVFFVTSHETFALEPSMELVERFRPDLLPLIRSRMEGHQAFMSAAKLRQAVGWQHELSWRT